MWSELNDTSELVTPALLFYQERIIRNIDEMIRVAGDTARLRPHVKTHKCAEIVKIHLEKGITKFKCATIAEAEMLGLCEASDVLVAYPIVGPNIDRFLLLTEKFPDTSFSTLVDNPGIVELLNAKEVPVDVFIDVDCGMHRTGIAPEGVERLMKVIDDTEHINFRGLHVYDGHLHDASIAERRAKAMKVWEKVQHLVSTFHVQGEVVIGGSPTFPIYAKETTAILSPGTPVLWDKGYGDSLEGLEMFEPAAVIASRVISCPSSGVYCLDAGHKAISAEHQRPPRILGLSGFELITHSEEHMVIQTNESLDIGAVLYLVPHHICPTVALYDEASVVVDGEIMERWAIQSRTRKISV